MPAEASCPYCGETARQWARQTIPETGGWACQNCGEDGDSELACGALHPVPADHILYLPKTQFHRGSAYEVKVGSGEVVVDEGGECAIGKGGVTVYSECCGDTMSVDTARKVHEALGRWLADQHSSEAAGAS